MTTPQGAPEGIPFIGRPFSKPYSERGIRRVDCVRGCGRKAATQWQACANGNRWLPMCWPCDVALNDLALRFFKFPNRVALMTQYRRKVKP